MYELKRFGKIFLLLCFITFAESWLNENTPGITDQARGACRSVSMTQSLLPRLLESQYLLVQHKYSYFTPLNRYNH